MLLGRLPRDAFVTAFLGILTSDSLRYTNAGHLPPLHVRGDLLRPLESHGLPLGVIEARPTHPASWSWSPATSCSRTRTA